MSATNIEINLKENIHTSLMWLCENKFKEDADVSMCKAGYIDASSNPGKALRCLSILEKESKKK
jgi:hypothetical protein